MAKQKKLNGKGTLEEIAAPLVSEDTSKQSAAKKSSPKAAAKKASPKKPELAEAAPPEASIGTEQAKTGKKTAAKKGKAEKTEATKSAKTEKIKAADKTEPSAKSKTKSAKAKGANAKGAESKNAESKGEEAKGTAPKSAKGRKKPASQVIVQPEPAEVASADAVPVEEVTEQSPAPRKGRRRSASAEADADSNRVVSLDEVRERVRSRGKSKATKGKASLSNGAASVDTSPAGAAEDTTSGEEISEDEASDDANVLAAGEQVPPSAPTADGSKAELSEDEENLRYLRGLVEALLFSSDKPLTVRELARAARLDRARTQQLLDELVSESKQRGVVLIEIAGGWTMRSNPSYASYVQKMLALRPVRLSRAQLETLAIIAYRQPVTRPEVDDIRGVDSGQVIKGLLDRDLIKMLGKKDEAGRPMLYGTAPAFLELFSLESLSELPSLKEFTELTQDSREYFESEIGETAPAGNLDDTNLDAPSRTLEDRESDDETLDGSVGLDADGSANLDADGSAPSSGDTPHSDTAAHSDAETTADSDAPPATEWPPTHADDEDDPEIEPANERTSTRRASAEPARDDDDDDDADDDDEDAKDDEEE